jgi:hypothetical protein
MVKYALHTKLGYPLEEHKGDCIVFCVPCIIHIRGEWSMVTNESKDLKVEGHRGKWYVIDNGFHNSNEVFLLEHQTYGEDVPCLIVDKSGKIILEDVFNGLSELDN